MFIIIISSPLIQVIKVARPCHALIPPPLSPPFSIDRKDHFIIASLPHTGGQVKTMISVEEARKRILDSISPLGLEKVNILDALGRVVGEDIHAGRDIPPKDNSAMDGLVNQ